jgi:DNA repair protein RAD5
MIAQYAGASGSDAQADGNGKDEGVYAKKVLEDIENKGVAECMICTSEIFDEVLLPCYHRGYVKLGPASANMTVAKTA